MTTLNSCCLEDVWTLKQTFEFPTVEVQTQIGEKIAVVAGLDGLVFIYERGIDFLDALRNYMSSHFDI